MTAHGKPRCNKPLRNGKFCGRPEGHAPKCQSAEAMALLASKRTAEHQAAINEAKREIIASRYRFVDSVKVTCGCVDCGYNNHPAALDFDHSPGTVKLGNVGNLIRDASWERLITEMEKCEVVCANCHRVRTAVRRNK